MYGLYQSPIRRSLQADIYRKPHGFIYLFGKEYFYLIKEKKVWPFTFREFQVMGIEIPDDRSKVREELKKVKHYFGKKWGNICFQFGIINEITSFDNYRARSQDIIGKVRGMRLQKRATIIKQTGLKLAFKENMPQSTITIKLAKSDEELLAEMNSGCADRVKKAIKKGVKVRLWTERDDAVFFEKRQNTAWGKGFHTITKEQYTMLLKILRKHNRGNVFISELNGEQIAGSICLFRDKTIVYLYGFTDRKYTNLWGHHYLKYGMFEWARDNGFEFCDLMGWAPTGFPEHPLAWVSKFKESLGGMKSEFYGSYDLVLNPVLYYLFKTFTRIRSKFKK